MTRRQQQAIERAARQAEAANERAQREHERLLAAFPTYSTVDRGARMESARRADAAAQHARSLRRIADEAARAYERERSAV